MTLDELNQLDDGRAYEMFYQCCLANKWVELMVGPRPFLDREAMQKVALQHWRVMQESDILEAFSGHPKIGDLGSLRKKYAKMFSQAVQEQSGMQQALEEVVQQLKDYNNRYEKKFGYIFIVFAMGKSAAEMFDLIKQRINNPSDEELINAAVEQSKITALRLDKLIGLEI